MKLLLMHRILLLHLLCLTICGCGGTESDSGSATLSGEQSETAASGGAPPTSSATRSFAPPPPVMVENGIRDGVEPLFSDAATALGIEFRFFEDRVPGRFLLPEVMGGGVAWLDVDLDGWQDLYFTNGAVLVPGTASAAEAAPGNRLYLSRRGLRFADVSLVSGSSDTGYGQGVAAGDFDADGFPDLFISNYGSDVLYHNNGDGTYSDITQSASIGDPLWSTSAVWLDLNDDGHLDLYCANYMDVTPGNSEPCLYEGRVGYCGPGKFNGLRDSVWLSDGTGGFRDGAAELGLEAPPSKGLAICAVDLDRDLRAEIYVANDMESNLLFTRTPAVGATTQPDVVKWRELASLAGAAVGGDGLNEASMGIAAADYDNDGQVDLYLTHYYQMKNTLYRNLGGLLFEDNSLRSGVAATSLAFLGFGTVPLDFNRDGWQDIFVANGHVLGPAIEPNAMTPQLLLNDGRRFRDVSSRAGPYFVDAWIGRGVSAGDFDNNGSTDVAVSHIDRPVSVLRNETSADSAWLGLRLSRIDRRSCCGARVKVTIGDRTTEQSLSAGGSYLSTNDDRLLFYGPPAAALAEVEVLWPDGASSMYSLPVNQHYQVLQGREPSGAVR